MGSSPEKTLNQSTIGTISACFLRTTIVMLLSTSVKIYSLIVLRNNTFGFIPESRSTLPTTQLMRLSSTGYTCLLKNSLRTLQSSTSTSSCASPHKVNRRNRGAFTQEININYIFLNFDKLQNYVIVKY